MGFFEGEGGDNPQRRSLKCRHLREPGPTCFGCIFGVLYYHPRKRIYFALGSNPAPDGGGQMVDMEFTV